MQIVVCHDVGGFVLTKALARSFARKKKANLSDIGPIRQIYNPQSDSERWVLTHYNIDSVAFRSDKDFIASVTSERSAGRAKTLEIIDVQDVNNVNLNDESFLNLEEVD
jgi:hypothetical protein